MKVFWQWCNKQVAWWGSRSLVWWLGHLTALYIGLVFLVLAARFDEVLSLPLNELGDFSAGVFGPIAFLWLVFGYKQQGDELKASSAALNEQVKELKNSIRLQVINAEKQDLMMDPVLYLEYVETSDVGGHSSDILALKNKGETCRAVHIDYGAAPPFLSAYKGLLGRDDTFHFRVREVALGEGIQIIISYKRVNGSKSLKGFTFYKIDSGPPVILPFLDQD